VVVPAQKLQIRLGVALAASVEVDPVFDQEHDRAHAEEDHASDRTDDHCPFHLARGHPGEAVGPRLTGELTPKIAQLRLVDAGLLAFRRRVLGLVDHPLGRDPEPAVLLLEGLAVRHQSSSPRSSQSSSSSSSGGVSFGPPKSERSRRTIALDPETVKALRRHRDAQLLERDSAGDAYQDRDLVFTDELGGAIGPDRLTDGFRSRRKAASIPTGTLHTLRHTAATLALTAGVPLHIVAARLGDKPETVLKTYAHLLPRSDEVAAERVAAAIDG
jgi:hypothetical protein